MRKKIFAVLLSGILIATMFFGCAKSETQQDTESKAAPADGAEEPAESKAEEPASDREKMVLYVSTPEDFLNVIVKEFEAETGVKVEVVAAGTGKLYKRIEG